MIVEYTGESQVVIGSLFLYVNWIPEDIFYEYS